MEQQGQSDDCLNSSHFQYQRTHPLQVTYSYIELYQSREAREQLLKDGFDFSYSCPVERKKTDHWLVAGSNGENEAGQK